jgi:hypothetical protein
VKAISIAAAAAVAIAKIKSAVIAAVAAGRRSLFSGLRLLQRIIDRGEFGAELGADALNRDDDRERDTAGNQAILDGGRAGFVAQEF